MQAKVKAHNTFTRFRCALCGGEIEKIGITTQVLNNNGGEVLSDICPGCVLAGPEAAAAAIRQRYPGNAELLEFAAALENGSAAWPTLTDWGRARLALDADMLKPAPADIAAWIEAELPAWLADMQDYGQNILKQRDARGFGLVV